MSTGTIINDTLLVMSILELTVFFNIPTVIEHRRD